METITEKEWETWCIENEATDTVYDVMNRIACGTPKEGDRRCFIIEG